MPKIGLQLISILGLVLFGLTAWGLSNSLDRITVLEARVENIYNNGLFESQAVQEELGEITKFAVGTYYCASNHDHYVKATLAEPSFCEE